MLDIGTSDNRRDNDINPNTNRVHRYTYTLIYIYIYNQNTDIHRARTRYAGVVLNTHLTSHAHTRTRNNIISITYRTYAE